MKASVDQRRAKENKSTLLEYFDYHFEVLTRLRRHLHAYPEILHDVGETAAFARISNQVNALREQAAPFHSTRMRRRTTENILKIVKPRGSHANTPAPRQAMTSSTTTKKMAASLRYQYLRLGPLLERSTVVSTLSTIGGEEHSTHEAKP